MASYTFYLFFFLFSLFLSISISYEVQLILVNNCNETVWPGVLGNAAYPTLRNGGFRLNSGEETILKVEDGWSGRIWARRGCYFDENNTGSCETGDCNGNLHCKGQAGSPPATIVEMTFGTSKSPLHYYDVSLVDGFNLPVSMVAVGAGARCGTASCDVDLNRCCPVGFEVRHQNKVVGCKSACLALNSARYCCTGDYYKSPKNCKPTLYSHLFKAICPQAYSFAYDDSSSLRSCNASSYLIQFCPPSDRFFR